MAPYTKSTFTASELKKHDGQMIEALGGTGVSLIRVAGEDSNSRKCLTTVGSLLLVGTATGLIHIYDVASHQLLRTISAHKEMSISHLTTTLKPLTADAKGIIPMCPVVPFHHMKDSKAREVHEVTMMFPVQEEVGFSSVEMGTQLTLTNPPKTSGGIPSTYDYPEAEFQGDNAFFVQPNAISTSKASSARVAKLEAEVENLREQLGKIKGIDSIMWETVVQKVMVQKNKRQVRLTLFRVKVRM